MAGGAGGNLLTAGELRERIEFLTPTRVDDHGFATVTWAAVFSVWAAARLQGGVVDMAQDRGAAKLAVDFDVRYRSDITSDMRIFWRGMMFEVNAPLQLVPTEGRLTIPSLQASDGSLRIVVTPNPANVLVDQTLQMSAAFYDDANTIIGGSATVVWSISDTSVATIDAVTGIVTAVSAGTATVTATGQGKVGSIALTVPALDSFVALIRAGVVGGDSAILAMYNTAGNYTDDGAGHVASAGWTDTRGSIAFGPTQTPAGAGGASIVGAARARAFRTDGGRALESALVSLLQQTAITLIWAGISTKNDNDYPAYIQCAALGDGFTGFNVGTNGSGETGFVNFFSQPGPNTIYNARHQSARVRSYYVYRNGTVGKIRGGLLNAIAGVVQSPAASTPAKIGIGNAAGGALPTTADTQVLIALTHEPTDAEWDAINHAIYTCNQGATGAPSAVVIHGDSIVRGHGLVPLTLGWASLVADALAPTINVELFGTDGIPISSVVQSPSLMGERAAQIDPIFTHAHLTKKGYVAEGGINDLRAGRTGAQAWADQQTRLAGARAATPGLWTAVPLLLPCSANGLGISQATLDAQILIYNNLARAGEGTDYSTGGCLDFRTLTGILDTDVTAYTDATKFVEAPIGIHPTAALSVTLANYATPKILALTA